MAATRSAYQGCLLGLAVGDAMGFPVDRKSWREIRSDYGPNGLMGYDLVNGYADITSHTQLCAFTCNGLLLGLTRGQLQGRMAPFVRYIALSQKEWAAAQRRYSGLQRTYCWVYWVEEFRRRRCTDNRMTDTLALDHIGTLEEPVNRLDGPDSLAAAVAVGMFAQPLRMGPSERDRLGAEAVALTYGNPKAFLSGAVVANLISAVLEDQDTPLEQLVYRALEAAEAQFAHEYPQIREVAYGVRHAILLAAEHRDHQQAMESLVCANAPQVLAGAVYALLACGGDFDAAMITAVNHSGRSSAVASLVGAVLGARMGLEALPEFYLECLEVRGVLGDLADDVMSGCPMERRGGTFDLDWDRKYLQGER